MAKKALFLVLILTVCSSVIALAGSRVKNGITFYDGDAKYFYNTVVTVLNNGKYKHLEEVVANRKCGDYETDQACKRRVNSLDSQWYRTFHDWLFKTYEQIETYLVIQPLLPANLEYDVNTEEAILKMDLPLPTYTQEQYGKDGKVNKKSQEPLALCYTSPVFKVNDGKLVMVDHKGSPGLKIKVPRDLAIKHDIKSNRGEVTFTFKIGPASYNNKTYPALKLTDAVWTVDGYEFWTWKGTAKLDPGPAYSYYKFLDGDPDNMLPKLPGNFSAGSKQ